MQNNTDDIRLRVPKGTKNRWKAAADAAGVSMTQFVVKAVDAAIEAQQGNSAPNSPSEPLPPSGD
jgi:uncharacterized protein (DUF1778 family)